MFNKTQATILLTLLCALTVSSVHAIDLYNKNNVLVVGNHNDGLSSSDISLILQVEAAGKIVVDEGHDVKFIAPDADARKKKMPPLHEIDFDDSGWEDGISGVGYSDGDDNTEIAGGDVAVIYTRYLFDVSNASKAGEILVRLDYDDGYVLWLNGEEIARSPNLEAISKVGEIPDWDLTAPRAKMQNHGATEAQAGKPNKNRAYQVEHEIATKFGGQDALSVEAQGKLTTIWGRIKNARNIR